MIFHSFFHCSNHVPHSWLVLICTETPVNEVLRAFNTSFTICLFYSFTWSSAYSKKHHSTLSQTSLLRDARHRPLVRASVKGEGNLIQQSNTSQGFSAYQKVFFISKYDTPVV